MSQPEISPPEGEAPVTTNSHPFTGKPRTRMGGWRWRRPPESRGCLHCGLAPYTQRTGDATPTKHRLLAHGILGDGSCFKSSSLRFGRKGHEVMAAQYGLRHAEGRCRRDHPHIRASQRSDRSCRPLLRRNCHHARRRWIPASPLWSTSRRWVRMRRRRRRANRTSSPRPTSSSISKSPTAASG